jgi:predicted secreted hydrolase
MSWRRWLLVVALATAAIAAVVVLSRRPAAEAQPTLALAAVPTEAGFARALAPIQVRLPQDHGPHHPFQTEWWYYTGNLEAADGRHYGYQLTFFRRGLAAQPTPRPASMAADQVYFAHLALTEVDAGRHQSWERFSRGAAGLAGAQVEPLRIWLEDWTMEALNADGSNLRLTASVENEMALDLVLQASKPLVLHGDQGLSPKSDEPGNASYYVSYTRLETSGTLVVQGEPLAVTGTSWFDHEWSTSALGPQAVGWDWFSLQLDDGRELMYFQIRRQDGSIEPVSGGTLVEPDGSQRRLSSEQVTVEVLEEWTSPETGATYPGRWQLAVPSAGIELTIEPWLPDQENRLSFTYWEGAVRFEGVSGEAAVDGVGFVELTGYTESMQGRF